jgi:hypothetical protein
MTIQCLAFLLISDLAVVSRRFSPDTDLLCLTLVFQVSSLLSLVYLNVLFIVIKNCNFLRFGIIAILTGNCLVICDH